MSSKKQILPVEDTSKDEENKLKPEARSLSLTSAAHTGKMKLFSAVAKLRETKLHHWTVADSGKTSEEGPRMLVAEKALAVAEEVRRLALGEPKNTLSTLSWHDLLGYALENRISSDNSYPFQMLAIYTTGVLVVLGFAWYQLSKDLDVEEGDELFGMESLQDGIFLAMQVIISAGFDDTIPDENGLRVLFFFMIFFGLVVFAVLVGFITDAVSQFMESLAIGRTKVAENGHTLILGWNEATLRCVVQIAFLRRQYQILNESKYCGLLWVAPVLRPVMLSVGLLERPSTSLAVSDIVIMTDTISKAEMHHQLELTLAERGIDSNRTKLGQNIICRVGDPTNVNDLIRVGTHRAAAILVMLTEQDETEEDKSDSMIQNGATLRSCLALRHILFTNPYTKEDGGVHPDLRIVLQMTKPSEYVDAACFKHADDMRDVIMPMDLSKFLNSLMFLCAAQPGLSKILLNLLDFEGCAIRRRVAKNLRSGHENKYGACVGHTFGEAQKQFATAVFVGILRPTMPKEEIKERHFGLCPDPNTIIEEDDLLIFIGPKSNPHHSYDMIATMDDYADQAAEIQEQHPDIALGRLLKGHTNSKLLQHLLVCGWRSVWQEHPDRLYDRIMEICTQRLPGSTITFLNSVDPDVFTELMIGKGLRRAADSGGNRVYEMQEPYQKIFIRHIQGDAAQPSVLSPVVNETTVHTVIVLGTQASIRLGARYRDTRVLNVMLLLRKLWEVKNEGVPMHIVGENNEDMTARLALAPKRKGNVTKSGKHTIIEHEPDFVNSQAVYARALVQTLAYPGIQPAINDLLEESDGSADIVIVSVTEYLPLNTEVKYGVVRATLLQAKHERSICLGILWASLPEPELMPAHDRAVAFCAEDRLVIIRRKLPRGDGGGTGATAATLFAKNDPGAL